jgi:homoserine dehydrogenase
MFWSAELNEVLTTLLSQYTTNNEIASRFLSQKIELKLTFDQIIRHIRKLKLGQIKNKSNTIQEDAHIQNKSNPILEDECGTIKEDTKVVHNEVQNKRDIVFSNKKRPYTKWKEMDESLWFVMNEDNGSTMLLKANLFVEKNPKIQKITTQILKQMKLISSK